MLSLLDGFLCDVLASFCFGCLSIGNPLDRLPTRVLQSTGHAGRNGNGEVSILTAFFNAGAEEQLFRLPPPGLPARLLVDSAASDAPERKLESEEVTVGARSVVLTLSTRRDQVG